MAGWLSRGSSLFRQPPPPPEPFEVVCDCGGRVAGQRTGSYQKPACPVCERPVFVLPANVYPQPKVKVKPFIPSAKSGKGADEKRTARASTNDVIDENPDPAPGARLSSPKKSSLAAGGKAASTGEAMAPREAPRPFFTPLRLVTMGIILMSALTIGGLWRRSRIEYAKTIVTKATDAGRQALKDRDFVIAAVEFDRARKAVDILGRTDDAANVIRQSSREATALANLSTSTLTECVEETLAGSKPGATEPLRMSSAIQGAWVIFDANLSLSSSGKNHCVLDSPIILKDGIVEIEINSPLIGSVLRAANPNEPARVIFAAQIEQITPFKGDPPTSVLTLNSKTVFLWANYSTYSSIGYRPFDHESEQLTRMALERQSKEKSPAD